MADEQTVVGFTISQFLTRVIPGSIVVLFGLLPVSDILIDYFTSTEKMPEFILDPYFVIFTTVIFLLVGEFIDIVRRSLFPLPSQFRLYLYYDEDDKAFLSPLQDPSPRVYYVIAVVIGLSISQNATQIVPLSFNILFPITLVILFPLVFLRKQILDVMYNRKESSNIRDYLSASSNIRGYFSNGSPDGFVEAIRSEYELPPQFNNPTQLFLLVTSHIEPELSSRTRKLQVLYHLVKNTYIAVLIGILLAAFIVYSRSSSIEVGIFVGFVILAALMTIMLNLVLGKAINIEDKYVRSVIIEFLSSIEYQLPDEHTSDS